MEVRAGQAAEKKWVASRGVKHYMQRVAVQGSPDAITAVTSIYQPHAKQNLDTIHPFKKYFEELQIGDSIIQQNVGLSDTDINRFADLSGDHFYAHDEHGTL